jgi:hypothetical protein
MKKRDFVDKNRINLLSYIKKIPISKIVELKNIIKQNKNK